jgi:hypothetical protein
MNILSFILLVLLSTVVSSNVLLENSCKNQPRESSNIIQATNQELSTVVSPQSKDIRQWISPTYLGLELGLSTEADVKRLFGKPIDEYRNQDEDKVFENDSEDEIVLDYKNSNGANDHVVVILGAQTKIVKAISIYPSEKISMQEAIAKYGSDFFQINSGGAKCLQEQHRQGFIDNKMEYPYILVYPNLGIFLDIRNYNNEITVGRIDYLMKCE